MRMKRQPPEEAGTPPLEGRPRVLKLGETFRRRPSCAFHTVHYDFKPASIDISSEGYLQLGRGEEVTIALPNIEGSVLPFTIFKGSKKSYPRDCILILNHDNGECILEKLSGNISVKKIRTEEISQVQSQIIHFHNHHHHHHHHHPQRQPQEQEMQQRLVPHQEMCHLQQEEMAHQQQLLQQQEMYRWQQQMHQQQQQMQQLLLQQQKMQQQQQQQLLQQQEIQSICETQYGEKMYSHQEKGSPASPLDDAEDIERELMVEASMTDQGNSDSSSWSDCRSPSPSGSTSEDGGASSSEDEEALPPHSSPVRFPQQRRPPPPLPCRRVPDLNSDPDPYWSRCQGDGSSATPELRRDPQLSDSDY
ncbi:ELL-associated factor 2-like [Tachyglossus aculeatus]|uniref:ELL-associated factor 2-like n=1 Tax=Tachyglossus aculeatus TaxID=9261 RepID=UPI0018F75585|nr:ELL-associated factor 2-like [Tachyglossus aculeatus]